LRLGGPEVFDVPDLRLAATDCNGIKHSLLQQIRISFGAQIQKQLSAGKRGLQRVRDFGASIAADQVQDSEVAASDLVRDAFKKFPQK
jgi:hypothetical protein